jgi:hypothetical protein
MPNGLGITPTTPINRAYIRDFRGPAPNVTSYSESMKWLALRHNAFLVADQLAFFASSASPAVELADFRGGTGKIYHHRIIGKGRMDTAVASAVTLGPSKAGLEPEKYGIVIPNPFFPIPPFIPDPVRVLIEMLPTEQTFPVLGDGDSTVPYHGAIGRTLAGDDRLYILDLGQHDALINAPPTLNTGGTMGLLQQLLDGTACSQSQAPASFLSQNQFDEIV